MEQLGELEEEAGQCSARLFGGRLSPRTLVAMEALGITQDHRDVYEDAVTALYQRLAAPEPLREQERWGVVEQLTGRFHLPVPLQYTALCYDLRRRAGLDGTIAFRDFGGSRKGRLFFLRYALSIPPPYPAPQSADPVGSAISAAFGLPLPKQLIASGSYEERLDVSFKIAGQTDAVHLRALQSPGQVTLFSQARITAPYHQRVADASRRLEEHSPGEGRQYRRSDGSRSPVEQMVLDAVPLFLRLLELP